MALKTVIDKLDDVEEALRPHYTLGGDKKYRLETDLDAKVVEFRQKNITLAKELETVRAEAAQAADLRTQLAATTDEYTAADAARQAADTALASERAALATAQQQAEEVVFRTLVSEAFLTFGGEPAAIDFIVPRAKGTFSVRDGKLTSAKFSADQPGQPLSIEEFLLQQSKDAAFAFKPSSGSGARNRPGPVSHATHAHQLVNPTPAELGRHANDIASGKTKVTYTE